MHSLCIYRRHRRPTSLFLISGKVSLAAKFGTLKVRLFVFADPKISGTNESCKQKQFNCSYDGWPRLIVKSKRWIGSAWLTIRVVDCKYLTSGFIKLRLRLRKTIFGVYIKLD